MPAYKAEKGQCTYIYYRNKFVCSICQCYFRTNSSFLLHRLPTFQPVCNTTCECDREKFSPICGQDGRTYFSACHAGCRNLTVVEGKIVEFSDCVCVSPDIHAPNSGYSDVEFDPNHDPDTFGMAKIGYCKLECSNFIWYIILFSFFVFIHSTSEVGSMLLILRCVDPRDKAMALGLIQFAIGLFGNVPCPIVYGVVVDSACLVWEMACGEQGACWLYDSTVFRMFYHGKLYQLNVLHHIMQ